MFGSQIVCDFEMDEEISLDTLKELILKEINLFNMENKQPEINIPYEIARLHKVQEILEEEKKKNKQKVQQWEDI